MNTKSYPTTEACLAMLREYGTPEHVQQHCYAVAKVAVKLALLLNQKGYSLNIDLIRTAGLLHDIARTEPAHWTVGALIAENKGYIDVADIIEAHMFYPHFSDIDSITETDIVCFADRTIIQDEYVGIYERMDYIIEKRVRSSGRNYQDVATEFAPKLKDIEHFVAELEKLLNINIDELFGKNGKR